MDEMTLQETEQQLHHLKVLRSQEWQKGKEKRDDKTIQSLHDQINSLRQGLYV